MVFLMTLLELQHIMLAVEVAVVTLTEIITPEPLVD
jgi:hypothetical protein